MERTKYFTPGAACPVRDVLGRLGDKWTVLVLLVLDENPLMRFGDIHRAIPDVSPRMLTATLRTLEADGIIRRRVYAEVPPKVEYSITDRGRSLVPHVRALVEWAQANMKGILEDRRAQSGNPAV